MPGMKPAVRGVCVLAGVLAAGAAVRCVGLSHGAPNRIYHPDVGKLAKTASDIYHGDLGPITGPGGDYRRKAYPFGHAILTAHVLRAADRVAGRQRPNYRDGRSAVHWRWTLILRWFAVVGALAGIAVLLAASRRLVTAPGWIAAGLLLALEPFHAQYSHYGMNDVPMVTALLLVWATGLGIPRKGVAGPLWAAVAGVCLGAGFGIKYQAVLGGVLLVPPAWQLAVERRWTALAGCAGAVAAGAAAGAWLTSPLLRRPDVFWTMFVPFMRWQSAIVPCDAPWPLKAGRNLLGMLRMTAASGQLAVAVLAVTGWVRFGRRRAGPTGRLQASGGLLFAGVLLFVLAGFRAFPRSNDLLPLFPVAAVLIGLSMPVRVRGASLRAKVWMAAVWLCVGWYGAVAVLDSRALARPDTRERALAWCRRNVRPGDTVYREHYTLPLRMDGVHEQFIGMATRGVQKGRILENRVDHLILSSLVYERYFDRLSPQRDARKAGFYTYLFENYPQRASFRDRRLFFAHPHIRILGPRPRES